MKSLPVTLAILFAWAGADLLAVDHDLPLYAGDKISLTVTGIPAAEALSINHIYVVAKSGAIDLPYLGSVTAADLEPAQLAHQIEQLFQSKQIFAHPVVRVIREEDHRVVHISGGVAKPGIVPYRVGMTVAKVIVSAGGNYGFHRLMGVKLIRKGKVIKELNLGKASSSDEDTLVEPDDEIVVPD